MGSVAGEGTAGYDGRCIPGMNERNLAFRQVCVRYRIVGGGQSQVVVEMLGCVLNKTF